jgi:hypothetical protein
VTRRRFTRLKLGPVVGHTTESASTIWIQAFDDPGEYQLRVQGAGTFDFVGTEGGVLEFCTGIAIADGLRPDWRYSYSILRRGRRVAGASGTFRTMPLPGSMAPILFCPISCNSDVELGSWDALKRFVDSARPHFLLMMGDQVYNDDDPPDVFEQHRESPAHIRRAALAEKYLRNWSRPPVQHVLSHLPAYMMWDDHDIRDGWGSLAANSPTMAQRYPRGQRIFEICDDYFRDARDVYWHFQGCHNAPLPPGFAAWPFASRTSLPCVFVCGRVLVLMLDSRGERDVFRPVLPVLGQAQWDFIEQFLADIPDQVDALVVMTPTPIASMDPHGASQKLVGRRTDDIEAFRKGDLQQAVSPKGSSGFGQFALAAAGSHLTNLFGSPVNLGNFNVNSIDEARDQWSHSYARPEQERLLRKCAQARLTNKSVGARELLFVSGDIHVGGIFDISIKKPKCKAVSLTSSGISVVENLNPKPTIGSILDDSFDVAAGIHSTLREVVTEVNFGVVQIVPTGTGAKTLAVIAHAGNSWAVGADIADLL